MLSGVRWRRTTGWATSNALIPNVGDKAINAEVWTTSVMDEELAYESEQDTHIERERERERERQKQSYFPKAIVTNDNQPLLKVTKSLYIVTNIGQLPFMLFTEITETVGKLVPLDGKFRRTGWSKARWWSSQPIGRGHICKCGLVGLLGAICVNSPKVICV